MRAITCFLLAAGLSVLAAEVTQESGTLALNDGRTLKNARIVAIGENEVSILHAGGLLGVPVEAVPLDVLARAHMAIEEEESQRKAFAEKIAARQQKLDEQKAQRISDEIKIRKAEALAREGRLLQKPQQLSDASVAPNVEEKLMALKAKFPRRERRSVPVVTNRTGSNNVVATATTRTTYVPSGRISETTYTDPRNRANVANDIIEVEVPRPDLYSHYQGWVNIATPQSLPKIIQRLEEYIDRDLEELGRQQYSISNQSGSAQARMTQEWIQAKLRPYLAELKKLERR